MAARRLHHRHAQRVQPFGDIGIGAHAVAQIILIHDLGQALCDRVEVAAGKAAIGREALGLDQPRAGLFGQRVIIQREPPADIGEGVLLGAHCHAVGHVKRVAHDLLDRAVLLPVLAQLDEPGVLGEPAAINEEGLAMRMGDLGGAANIGEADRLAAACIVRDRHHHTRHGIAALTHQLGEGVQVHVPLEGMVEGGNLALCDGQVQCLGACGFDIAARRVEMRV